MSSSAPETWGIWPQSLAELEGAGIFCKEMTDYDSEIASVSSN
jgi:hypothetical protein